MRSAHKLGLAAAAAGAMILAPLPALAAEDDSEATGTLTVTRFDDRYADGLFDTSQASPNGDVDRLNSDGPAQLVDVDGKRWYISADADGLYRFENVPVGPAKLYLGHPNDPAREAFFDATGAVASTDIRRMPTTQFWGAQGTLDVVIDADGEERLIGMTAIKASAKVSLDEAPVSGAQLEFWSGGEWLAASEYAGLPGGYAVLDGYNEVTHMPGELGLRVTAPAGYAVKSVEAFTGSAPLSYPDIAMTLTERDGAYWVDSRELPLYFFGAGFHVTLEETPDTVKPVATLVSPTTAGPFQTLNLQVDATDDRGLDRIVANIYKDGKLVKSTQTAGDGATAATHTASVSLPDGAYTVKYNASDLAGNVAQTGTFAFAIDRTAPTVTVKDGATYTNGANGVYGLVSFKLSDAGKIDKVVLNGKVKDLTNSQWSDLNYVKPGVFGAVEGVNTLVAYDVAGNTTTVTFTLDGTGPTVTVKDGSNGAAQSFKLYDANKVDKVTLNGVSKDLTNNVWSDVNGVKPGTFGAVSGLNTLVAYDVFGNMTTVRFTLD
ncbi:hypothetical protein GCM10009775_10580 [Microbacterium aoyamense]|uniref:Ig-like domain-containing protein n=1 Tax=Microbacterium aoyamense TaxID=344166 RepID=A0ABP5ASL0_9MICO|nr:Ig-like domain-containing protein [Microbacterium aoyamense]